MRFRDQAGPAITPYSMESIGKAIAAEAEAAPTSMAWVGANRGIFVPFVLPRDTMAKKLFWSNGSTVSAAGTIDVGIYSDAQARLISTGPTAQGTASVIQEVDIADTVIPAGRNWLAMSCSSTTCQFFGRNPGSDFLRWLGCYIQGAVATLPATGTWVAPNNNALIPIFGFVCGPVP